MAANHFRVTFEADGGVSWKELQATVGHVQKAIRAMTESLGGRDSKGGRPPNWVAEQSALEVFGISPGSLVIDLGLAEPSTEADSAYVNYGPQALEAILSWEGPGDLSLPQDVTQYLESIGTGLSVGSVRLSSASGDRGVTIPRAVVPRRKAVRRNRKVSLDDARVRGMLMEVNWKQGSAQLHPVRPFAGERHVPLRFDVSLGDEMLRHAMKFVTIAGTARYTGNGEYESFRVEDVIPDRPNEEFSREALEEALANAKPYDPRNAVTASEPFDVMEFIRTIHEVRDAS